MSAPHPVDRLLQEHAEIMGEVKGLRAALEALDRRGEEAVPEAVPAFRAVAEMMGTRLVLHARKEDEALFPALEAVWGRTEGVPTAIMRMEHSMIHRRVSRFRETLALLEAQHPEIVKRTAELRNVLSEDPDLETLRTVGAEITRLLDAHFGKEEEILFPMAREILSPDALREIDERMETISRAASPPS